MSLARLGDDIVICKLGRLNWWVQPDHRRLNLFAHFLRVLLPESSERQQPPALEHRFDRSQHPSRVKLVDGGYATHRVFKCMFVDMKLKSQLNLSLGLALQA